MESKLLLKETNKYDHTKKKTKLCLIFEKIRIQLSRNNFILLDKFCMKYEVRKALYAVYNKNKYTPVKSHGNANIVSYIYFANCLCLAYEKSKSLKYLSTLIKVNDALCSISQPL